MLDHQRVHSFDLHISVHDFDYGRQEQDKSQQSVKEQSRKLESMLTEVNK